MINQAIYTYLVGVSIEKALLEIPCHCFVEFYVHLILNLCLNQVELERVVAAAEVDFAKNVLKNLSGTFFVLLICVSILHHGIKFYQSNYFYLNNTAPTLRHIMGFWGFGVLGFWGG